MIARPACSADAEAVAAIWNHYIRHTTVTFNPVEKTVVEVDQTIASRPAFFVAETGGRIEGFATYAAFRSGLGYARTMEHTILLAPGSAGRGLGRALMAAVEHHARTGGAHSLFAVVSGENPEGRAFHARLGYAEAAILREVGWKFGRWLDAVLMQKFLS